MKGRIESKADLRVVPYHVDAYNEPDQRGFYSAAELEQRGWTYHMVRTFLRPDRKRKNVRDRTRRRRHETLVYQCSPLEYEYSREQVILREATEAWQKAKARADRKVGQAGAWSKPSEQTGNKLPDPRFSSLSVLTPSPTRNELMPGPLPVTPGSDSAKGRLDERMRQRFKNIDRAVAKEAKE